MTSGGRGGSSTFSSTTSATFSVILTSSGKVSEDEIVSTGGVSTEDDLKTYTVQQANIEETIEKHKVTSDFAN